MAENKHPKLIIYAFFIGAMLSVPLGSYFIAPLMFPNSVYVWHGDGEDGFDFLPGDLLALYRGDILRVRGYGFRFDGVRGNYFILRTENTDLRLPLIVDSTFDLEGVTFRLVGVQGSSIRLLMLGLSH